MFEPLLSSSGHLYFCTYLFLPSVQHINSSKPSSSPWRPFCLLFSQVSVTGLLTTQFPIKWVSLSSYLILKEVQYQNDIRMVFYPISFWVRKDLRDLVPLIEYLILVQHLFFYGYLISLSLKTKSPKMQQLLAHKTFNPLVSNGLNWKSIILIASFCLFNQTNTHLSSFVKQCFLNFKVLMVQLDILLKSRF
jgi:hypothetical protein